MEQLYHLFQQAPVLGSLIDPKRVAGDLLVAEFHELQPLLEKALSNESARGDENIIELGITACGLAHTGEILGAQFDLVATNVPYLGRSKQDDILKKYCDTYHQDAKADVATCFVERCLALCGMNGTSALVTPQNWLFLSSYSKLRAELLSRRSWNMAIKLGPNAFQDMNWWASITLLCIISASRPPNNNVIAGLDVGDTKDQNEKAQLLCSREVRTVSQLSQLHGIGHVVTFEDLTGVQLLRDVAKSVEGLSTGDGDRFLRKHWEFGEAPSDWEYFHVTPDETGHFGGLSELVFWEHGQGALSKSNQARVQGHYAWGKPGVLVSKMNRLKCCLYFGTKHDKMSAAIIPNNVNDLIAVWNFCASEDYHNAVRLVSQKVDVATNTLLQVPFDLSHWKQIAAAKYPNGLPKPCSEDPTQWIFNGQPMGSTAPLQVAVARLLGYRWPRQTGSSFPDCPALGSDGLEKFIDEDGIVCINPIKGEQPAADRLRGLLTAAFGNQWTPGKQNELLEHVGYGGKTLEDWLRNGFFEQHCQLFHQRPFIWQIWDGQRDGFSALVNSHKLNKSNLEKLTYTFLGDWISRQRVANEAGEEGSDARLQAALELKSKLEKIIEGEAPCDIFVRWKPLEKQPIGWEPDLNDGVRLNIRPFVIAGVLRKNPKINWNKDRGAEAPSAPWYELGPTYGGKKGDRINDHHLKLEDKRKARGKG
jgi:hypothetical protein